MTIKPAERAIARNVTAVARSAGLIYFPTCTWVSRPRLYAVTRSGGLTG
jgi:hypothetical protein